MPLKLLAVGDLHLGRAPSRLPDELAARARALGPAGAWQRIVDAAIDARVDAVALAGDVVEQENDFFEAYRELAGGVHRLLEAGIRVLAIVGNHDVRVLPRLADRIEGFELVGRGGVWQRVSIEAGGERLTLHGWSFPQRSVRTSPLSGQRFERAAGVNIGLLHCDRDRGESDYAPVATRELEAAGLDAWLLGHVHAPDALTVAGPFGYLGSATALDPGEHGPRGPWLVTADGGRIVAVEHWPLAPISYERIAVSLTGIATAEDARDRLLDAVGELDGVLSARVAPPTAAALRVRLSGRTDERDAVEAMFAAENLDALPAGSGGIHYFVERLDIATQPAIELTELARQNDPPGLLARRLLLLDADAADPARRALLSRARAQLTEQTERPEWRALDGVAPDDETVAVLLRDAAYAALGRLLAQREAPG